MGGGVIVERAAGFAACITDLSQRDEVLRVREFAPGLFVGGANAATDLSTFEDITGSDARDALNTDRGDNVIDGLDGDDLLAGRDGDDTLIGGDGDDSMQGGRGIDLIDYSQGFRVGVTFAQGFGLDDIADGATMVGVEDLIGTVGADRLIGSDADNRFEEGLSRDDRDEGVAAGRVSTAGDLVLMDAGRDRLVVDWSDRDTGTGMTGGLEPDGTGSFERRQSSSPQRPAARSGDLPAGRAGRGHRHEVGGRRHRRRGRGGPARGRRPRDLSRPALGDRRRRARARPRPRRR